MCNLMMLSVFNAFFLLMIPGLIIYWKAATKSYYDEFGNFDNSADFIMNYCLCWAGFYTLAFGFFGGLC